MKRAALLALLPAAAMAEPWHGDWAGEPGWCANAEKIGSATPAPIRLSEVTVVGYENSCAITGIEDTGLYAWILRMTCEAEGSTYDDARLVMVSGNDMWMWFGGDAPVRFHRCPE